MNKKKNEYSSNGNRSVAMENPPRLRTAFLGKKLPPAKGYKNENGSDIVSSEWSAPYKKTDLAEYIRST